MNTERMDTTKKCIGIDLGTTNTSVAMSSLNIDGYVVLEDQPISQTAGNYGSIKMEVLPSIVYFEKNGKTLVGAEAEVEKSRIRSKEDEIRFVENSKRDIGKNTTYLIGGKTYTPTDIAQKILKYAVANSNIKGILPDSYIFVTVPANFGIDERGATIEAAKKAGLKNVKLYPEPKAAILSYIHNDINKREEDRQLQLNGKKRILVIDIGGGTCDICIEDVEYQDKILKIDSVGEPNRVNIGGVDFDIRVAEFLKKNFLTNDELTQFGQIELMKTARAAKEFVSNKITQYIGEMEEYTSNADVYRNLDWLDIISDAESWKKNDALDNKFIQSETIIEKDIRYKLNPVEFIKTIKPLVKSSGINALNQDMKEKNKNVEDLIFDTLKENKIGLDSIDYVFLTGGMAKCFPIEAMIYDLLKKPILIPKEPLLAASRGAALLNKYPSLYEESRDTMSRSIMLELVDGSFYTLIDAGNPVPCELTPVDHEFRTKSRNGMEIRLFEGKNEFDWELRKVNTVYRIPSISKKVKDRQFIVSYEIDKNKQPTFEICFIDTDEKHIIHGSVKEEISYDE